MFGNVSFLISRYCVFWLLSPLRTTHPAWTLHWLLLRSVRSSLTSSVATSMSMYTRLQPFPWMTQPFSSPMLAWTRYDCSTLVNLGLVVNVFFFFKLYNYFNVGVCEFKSLACMNRLYVKKIETVFSCVSCFILGQKYICSFCINIRFKDFVFIKFFFFHSSNQSS